MFARQKNIHAALGWLGRSINPETGGSRAYYSRIHRPLTGWSAEYPETSGYIIPTFFDAAQRFPQYEPLRAKAFRMADWVLGLQTPDGGLPGGFFSRQVAMPRSVFNTGQMIKGLARAYREGEDAKYLDAAARAAHWLRDQQNPDGTWTKHAYRDDFSPSYYSRVAWPMLIVWQLTGDETLRTSAVSALEAILKRVNSKGYVEDCGFAPGGYAFLHTMVYAMRGFLESAVLLERDDFWDAGKGFAEKLLLRFEIRHRLSGAYYPDFREVSWYECLTGNCQLAIAWMKIFGRDGDIRYLNAASKAIDRVAARQSLTAWDPGKRGGIAGSAPFWGRYMAFRYPNWAAKFFTDALLLEGALLKKLAEPVAASTRA